MLGDIDFTDEAKKIGNVLMLDTEPDTALGKKKVNEYKQLSLLK